MLTPHAIRCFSHPIFSRMHGRALAVRDGGPVAVLDTPLRPPCMRCFPPVPCFPLFGSVCCHLSPLSAAHHAVVSPAAEPVFVSGRPPPHGAGDDVLLGSSSSSSSGGGGGGGSSPTRGCVSAAGHRAAGAARDPRRLRRRAAAPSARSRRAARGDGRLVGARAACGERGRRAGAIPCGVCIYRISVGRRRRVSLERTFVTCTRLVAVFFELTRLLHSPGAHTVLGDELVALCHDTSIRQHMGHSGCVPTVGH